MILNYKYSHIVITVIGNTLNIPYERSLFISTCKLLLDKHLKRFLSAYQYFISIIYIIF